MMHGADVPIPPRLARRPRDKRGYPIPHGVVVEDGVPNFTIGDARKWAHAFKHRLCGLCGDTLGRHLAFVGGPLCHANRVFLDLPMHRECAEYALQVCPYLALPKATYTSTYHVPEGYAVAASQAVSPHKPDRFWLGVARDYALVQLGDGVPALRASPWTDGQWWQDGKPVEGGA